MRFVTFATITLSAAMLAGCVTTSRERTAKAGATAASQQAEEPDPEARFAATLGSPKIRISLGDQRAYFYKGGELVTSTRISTGREGRRTPEGSFHITEKELHHHSTLYGKYVSGDGSVVNGDVDVNKDPKPEGASFVGASMPYFMRFNGGIGMHAGYVPNYPASHGCVRLPRRMAELFYEHAPVGTPVAVTD